MTRPFLRIRLAFRFDDGCEFLPFYLMFIGEDDHFVNPFEVQHHVGGRLLALELKLRVVAKRPRLRAVRRHLGRDLRDPAMVEPLARTTPGFWPGLDP